MTLTEQIISILIAAVVTMATRFIPFLFFDQSKDLSLYLPSGSNHGSISNLLLSEYFFC